MNKYVINGLKLPNKLIEMLENGKWKKLEKTNLKNILKLPQSHKLKFHDLDNERIKTYCLQLIISESKGMMRWPTENWLGELFLGRPGELVKPGTIDVNKALLIADIGIGMDSPFALDYRNDINNPCVIYLTLSRKGTSDSQWMKVANDFDEFVDLIECIS